MLFRGPVTCAAMFVCMCGALSSVGRAEPLQGLGREFEPLSAHQYQAKYSFMQ
jgi:hypothetical protein